MNGYEDIIDIPSWEPSERHPRMSRLSRAAQFAPFAALTGFDDMVDEAVEENISSYGDKN